MPDTDPSLYQLLGGETGLRALVDRFYDLMDTAPEARQIRALHPASLDGSREKLFLFLSGWTGGPSLYIERFGHPRLRQRHAPFAIGVSERDEWLWCLEQALDRSPMPPELLPGLKTRFAGAADFLRNRPEA